MPCANLTPDLMTRRILLSWSSGKDSAWSLHELRTAGENVVGLLTTLNAAFDRVAMHAVRADLLRAQAEAADLPLTEVPLPWPCSNEQYEVLMTKVVADARAAGITHVAFGDLFLEDIRAYRERMLDGTGLEPIFPLWKRPTAALAKTMQDGGLRAVVTSVDPRRVPSSIAGREWDATLLAELPADVDPCAENGEFHTCVYDGPMFSHPLPIARGEVVERDGFIFADLLLAP